MKYPQLVSTRAVNAISDWLVSRLEQLGVEAPQIYTRLLLSLLQSAAQINDPIEFNNLETFFARKGNHKRYQSTDSDTLKKFNAVQCLLEIVSSDEEISAIENLVDELFEKLKVIEKQSGERQSHDDLFLSIHEQQDSSSEQQKYKGKQKHLPKQSGHHSHAREEQHQHKVKYISGKGRGNSGGGAAIDTTEDTEIETDPKRRYFRAFPALSKEMEDSFSIWRQNSKALTWPVERHNHNHSISTSSSSSTIASSICSDGAKVVDPAGNRSVADKIRRGESQHSQRHLQNQHHNNNNNHNHNHHHHHHHHQHHCHHHHHQYQQHQHQYQHSNQHQHQQKQKQHEYKEQKEQQKEKVVADSTCNSPLVGLSGVKIKSKRRRHYGRSKGRTIQAIRKNSFSNSTGGNKTHRNSAIAFWDTEFEGCWEMGRDLIKEFIVKQQNKNQRNRSRSESATCEMNKQLVEDSMTQNTSVKLLTNNNNSTNNGIMDGECITDSKASSPIPPPLVDISFCDEDYDDTLASISDINTELAPAPRRLYERDLKLGSPLTADHADFAQFKAKFNSSIEALWRNVNEEDEPNAIDVTMDGYSLASGNQQLNSMPVMAPFKEDLKNFWTNYYNHQVETHKSQGCYKIDDSLSSSGNTTLGGALSDFNTSDYYSMPCNIHDFERSVGGTRRGGRHTPVSVFLQNSIWSDHSNGIGGSTNNVDSDEIFYYKVWNSSKKLKQPHGGDMKSNDGMANYDDGGAYYPPYTVPKWSEGINAGPIHNNNSNITHQLDIANKNNNNHENSMCNIDCVDAGHSSVFTSNWSQQMARQQNSQIDYQSAWSSSSNPISLNNIYSNVVENTKHTLEIGEQSAVGGGSSNNGDSMAEITLENHSNETSGFIAYSRVKAVLKTVPIRNVHSMAQILRPKEQMLQHQTGDDENLLTSERTHFYPIKTFADGHTFDIRDTLTHIEYERSNSGYLYVETDKYLEYTRIDSFIADADDGACAGVSAVSYHRTTTAPLYASSNCEATCGRASVGNDHNDRQNKSRGDFLIHFRVCNPEVGCQTEPILENVPHHRSALHMMSFVGDKLGAKNLPINIHMSDWINRSDVSLGNFNDLNNFNRKHGGGGYDCQTDVWTTTQTQVPAKMFVDDAEYTMDNGNSNCGEDESSCSSGGPLEQKWSMSTMSVGQKCLSNTHLKNVDGAKDDAGLHTGTYTLWSMCAACNNDLKSMPANRLLRDELQLEADEIMSDLRYMQDLYICRADDENDDENEGDTTGDEYLVLDKQNSMIVVPKIERKSNSQDVSGHLSRNDATTYEQNMTQQTPEAKDVLLRMNRLIADLLRPENAPREGSSEQGQMFNSEELSAKEKNPPNFGNGSWFLGGKRNIWQQGGNMESNGLKPIELANALQLENDKFLTQLSWEHDNLAKIWHTTPDNVDCVKLNSPQPSDDNYREQIDIDNNENLNRKSPTLKLCEMSMESTRSTDVLPIETNSMLPNNTVTTTTSTATTAANTPKLTTNNLSGNTNAAIKRMQHLLNTNISTNTISKLKLATRKRRHSASQNFYHMPHGGTVGPINNNNIAITDLNKYNLKLHAQKCNPSASALLANYSTSSNNWNKTNDNHETANMEHNASINVDNNADELVRHCLVQKSNSGDYAGYNGDDDVTIEPKQTIITCKYWTTIEPMADHIDTIEEGGSAFACLIDKNASILKHVTMVTRPLTR